MNKKTCCKPVASQPSSAPKRIEAMPPSLALPEREHALAARNGDWGSRHHHKGSVQSASCSVGPHMGRFCTHRAPISGGSAPNISPEQQAALEAPCHIVGNRGAVIGCGVRAALDWGLGLQGLGSGSWGVHRASLARGCWGACCVAIWVGFGCGWVTRPGLRCLCACVNHLPVGTYLGI